MSLQLLEYYWRKLRGDPNLDFFSEGLGIEARFLRCSRFWNPHLECCKQFISEVIGRYAFDSKSAMILGAGRLLDIPTDFLHQIGGEVIHLVDADPGAVKFWRNFQNRAPGFGVRVESHNLDITGRFNLWTSTLADSLSNLSKPLQRNAAADAIKALLKLPRTELSLPECNIVVSANTLGQLPINWRRRASKTLLRFGLRYDPDTADPNDSIDRALGETCALLEQEHLELIQKLATKLIVLLSDDTYFFYQSDIAEWQAEPALSHPIPSDLEGLELKASDSWYWHVVPQGIEELKYGCIHRVQARAWSKDVRFVWPGKKK